MKRALLTAAAAAVIVVMPAFAQDSALNEIVSTEQAFSVRSLAVGWKQAFLEYFADTAVWLNGVRAEPAKRVLREYPEPSKDLHMTWEPRYGDVATSGDLGYLTGLVHTVEPTRNNGQPADFIYASVWKRQADGSFKVVMRATVVPTTAVPFADGFSRASRTDTAPTAPSILATKTLKDADAALVKADLKGPPDYRDQFAQDARMYWLDTALVGRDAIVQWQMTRQPQYESGKSMSADTAMSGELGYTYGSYDLKSDEGRLAMFYLRVWTRGLDGVWRVTLDLRDVP